MIRRAVLVLLLCVVSSTSFAHSRKKLSHVVDGSYSSALAAANRFLHAWQTEDHETGIVMLSDSARQHASSEKLQRFFSPGPQAAYEIAHGRRMNEGEYSFPVVLFNGSDAPARPHFSTILVTHEGKSGWAVSKLP
ncbi:MAG TPA: hypothetical protein VFA85_10360 [Terriglobales bacterium]|nr:hypothetical protein [Terriglobales bacterium]